MKIVVFLFLFFSLATADEEKPDIMQVLFLKVGIEALSNDINGLYSKSKINSIELDKIEERISNIENNMDVLINFIDSQELEAN